MLSTSCWWIDLPSIVSLVFYAHEVTFDVRFLRKCSGKPGEWEDVGDIIAREKTSQVLRDAIQARKSFSGDGDRHVRKRNTLDTRKIRKSPSQKVTKTPVQKSFAPSRQPLPVTQWRTNLPLPYRAKNQAYSPAYTSVSHPVQAYGRVSMSDFGNALEGVPNFPNAPLPYHQYPVTPTSSGIAVSTARKRARYSEESPLLQGYHQYPYPTPIRHADPSSSSPHRPPVFSTPPNARDLSFSPPNSHKANPRRISIAQTVEKKHPVRRDTAQLKPPPPVYKPKVPPENRIADSQDLAALLNDEVLSDSSNQGDLMFQNSF